MDESDAWTIHEQLQYVWEIQQTIQQALESKPYMIQAVKMLGTFL